MTRKIVQTEEAPAPVGPYSQAVRAGDWLFVSGQIALDPLTGELVHENAAAQAARVLENIGAILRAAGMDYADVVKTTIFLTDLRDFAAVNEVYARYFSERPPARSTVQVSALPKGARVEIETIAVKGGGSAGPC
ncbi:MAG: RidA family protein [Firmicutes bacterium]|nr:RidA family protein [Bacillota bacterium]